VITNTLRGFNVKRIIISLVLLLTGSILFQSFQCSSKEMTTAKIAYDQKDYPKAKEYIKKELQLNPASVEAYQILTEINMQLGEWKEAAENSKKAYKNASDPIVIDNIKRLQNNIWTQCYNKGLRFYNLNLSKSDPTLLDSAIAMFEAGSIVRPEFEDFSYMNALTYEMKEDEENAIKYYKEYISKVQPEVDYLVSNGAFLNMPRTEALKKFGEPDKSTGQPASREKDSIIIDYYEEGGKDNFVFYYSENRAPFNIMGVRVDAPDYWLDSEKRLPADLKKSPFAALAQIYFTKNDYQKALEYAELITQIDPSDQQVSRFVIELYTKMDKIDVAKEKLEGYIKNDPGNKLFYAQYGDIFLNNKEFLKAVEQYEKALEIDPEFSFALRNAATAYKNHAVILQQEQQKKYDEDDTYEIKTDEYFPYLEKSAVYFEKALKTKDFKNDFQVLGELTNIYSVLEDEDDLKRVVKQLESIEFSIKKENKESYYYILLKVYSDMGEEDKMKVIQKKLEKYE
jgi:tetratricopeptide (TPR) repeat protein